MAYSRWGSSRWYCYASGNGGEDIFTLHINIDTMVEFKVQDIRDNLRECIEEVIGIVGVCTYEEIKELENYMLLFSKDCGE